MYSAALCITNLRVEDYEVAMVVSRARGVCVKRVVGGGGGGGGGGKGCVQAGVAAGFDSGTTTLRTL